MGEDLPHHFSCMSLIFYDSARDWTGLDFPHFIGFCDIEGDMTFSTFAHVFNCLFDISPFNISRGVQGGSGCSRWGRWWRSRGQPVLEGSVLLYLKFSTLQSCGVSFISTSTLYNLGGEQLLWTNFHFLLLPSRLLPSEGSSSLRNLMNIFMFYFSR